MSLSNANITFNTGGMVVSPGTLSIATGTIVSSGTIIGHSGRAGVVGGIDIFYDMDGRRLEEGQSIVVGFGHGKLRVGRIVEIRQEQGELVVNWLRGFIIPKKPSIIKVHENRILVIS